MVMVPISFKYLNVNFYHTEFVEPSYAIWLVTGKLNTQYTLTYLPYISICGRAIGILQQFDLLYQSDINEKQIIRKMSNTLQDSDKEFLILKL